MKTLTDLGFDDLFTPQTHDKLLGKSLSDSERIARDYLLAGGKRLRPQLAMLVYAGLGGDDPAIIRPGAMAIECFHKASLIHDDIQDEAKERDGIATIQVTHGLAIAINVGDLLIHWAYRLLWHAVDFQYGEWESILTKTAKLQAQMAVGQGIELWRRRENVTAPPDQLLESFAMKTSSCFVNALLIGACCGKQVDETITKPLEAFGGNFGICYQILDGLRDGDLPTSADWDAIGHDYFCKGRSDCQAMPHPLGSDLYNFILETCGQFTDQPASHPPTP